MNWLISALASAARSGTADGAGVKTSAEEPCLEICSRSLAAALDTREANSSEVSAELLGEGKMELELDGCPISMEDLRLLAALETLDSNELVAFFSAIKP